MRKKLKLFIASLVFGGFATIGITACGVMPTPVSIDAPDTTQQDEMINTLFDTKYLDASLDVNVKYQKDKDNADNYHLYGDMTIDLASLDNIMADASLHLDMNDPHKTDDKHRLPIINLDLTYLDSTAYVSVNERNLKMKTDDFGTILEIIMGEGTTEVEEEVESSINNLSNTGIAELINNLATMTYEDKGEYYEFVSKTTANQPDLVVKTDTAFKIKSLAISGIKYNDFTIDVLLSTKVMDALETPIVSPETATKKYIDVSTYFGAFKKIRKVLDDERFSLNYLLELRHYEPATPEDKVYLGYTRGDLSMDMKRTILDLRGSTIAINDPATSGHDDYVTSFRAQYFDENIYLQYNLNQKDASGNPMDYKLSYSNAGLADMWDLLGDESVLGINFFDLIFGASDKEYPIIDILTDGLYKNITEYTQINFADEYIELDIDNYLLGGKGHGSIRINVDEYDENDTNKPGIKSIVIKDLDINSYIVDGELSFKDYVAIEKVNAVEFHPLDSLDKLIRSGAKYYRSNKYALGLDVEVKNPNGEKLTINGDAKLKLKDSDGNAVLEGGANVKVVDFSRRLHTLVAETKKEGNSNNLYVGYTYQGDVDDEETAIPTFKAKASYDSIYSIYQDVMKVMSSDSSDSSDSNALGMIAPFIEGATADTLEKVMSGDYFAVLRDESIKSIEVINGNYKIAIDAKAMLGFDCDLVISLNMNKETLQSVGVSLGYNGYSVKATVTLKDYDTVGSYIPDNELSSYQEVSHISKITSFIAQNSHNGSFKLLDQIMSTYNEESAQREIGLNIEGTLRKDNKEILSITDGRLDAALADAVNDNEDMLSRLSFALSGTFNRQEEVEDELGVKSTVNHASDFKVGYKKNAVGDDTELSLAIGNALKFKAERVQLEDIINFVNTEILNPKDASQSSTQEVEAANSISLPILTMLNKKDYKSLIESIKGISVEGTQGDVLRLTISNGIFNDTLNGEDDNFSILLAIDDTNGVSSLSIRGARYHEYSLDFTISIDDNESFNQAAIDTINTDGYIDLADLSGVVYQVKDILSNRSLGIDLDTAKYGDITITGSADVKIGQTTTKNGVTTSTSTEYAIQLFITDKSDAENVKYHDIRIEYDGSTCFIAYAQDRESITNDNTVRIKIGENGEGVNCIDDIVSTFGTMMASEDSYLNEYLAQYLGSLTTMLGGTEIEPDPTQEQDDSGFDILSILYKDYFVNNGITYIPAVVDDEHPENNADAKLHIVANGETLGLSSNPNILIYFDENGYIYYIDGSMTFTNENENTHEITYVPASIKVGLRDYNPSKHNVVIPPAVRGTDGLWVGASDINNVVHYFADLGKDKQKAIIDQLNDIMGKNDTETNHVVLDFNFDIRRDPDVAPISEIRNGKIYLDFTDIYDKTTDTTDLMMANLKVSANVYKENVINSSFDLRLVDKMAYFKYVHDSVHEDFRVKYNLNNLDDLMAIVRKYAAENPTFKQLVDGVMPSATSSSSSASSNTTPISRIMGGNYAQIFKYYDHTTYDKQNGKLYLVFKGELLGIPEGNGNVTLGLSVADYGIQDISINNFYAFGYYLNGTLTLRPGSEYVEPAHPTDKDTYVTLDHVNDMLEDVLSLFGSDYRPVNYSLSGKYDDMLLDANFDFYINKDENSDGVADKNVGSAKIALSMGEKTHFIQADLNAQLISLNDYQNQDEDPAAKTRVENAALNSKILFSYGDTTPAKDSNGNITGHGNEASTTKMYGELNLGSIFDIVELVTEVTGEKSGRIANIMEIFASEGSQTLFQKILGGDVEALLYNKLIDSCTYDSSSQTYHIVLNENLFKLHEDDYASPIELTLATGDTIVTKKINGENKEVPMKYIKQLKVEGRYSGKPIELELLATNTPIIPISVPNEFNSGHGAYNFNSVQDLARGLLNTVMYSDYTFNGKIKLKGNLSINLGIWEPSITFTDATIDVKSFLHIIADENDKLEDYYAKFDFTNVPFISAVGYNISDDRDQWSNSNRSFSIYVKNIVRRENGVAQFEQVPVVDSMGRTIYKSDGVTPLTKNGSVLRDTYVIIESTHKASSGGATKVRRLKLTMDEFMDNLTHWLVNYGMGIKARNNGSSMTGDVYATKSGDVITRQTSNTNDFINLFNYHSESTHTPTYSTLLKSYNYYGAGERVSQYDQVLEADKLVENKTWTATVDIKDLTNNDMLQACGVAIYGGHDSEGKEFLKNLLASITMGIQVSIVQGKVYADVGLTVDPTTVSDAKREENKGIVNDYFRDYYNDDNTHDFEDYLLGGAGYVA